MKKQFFSIAMLLSFMGFAESPTNPDLKPINSQKILSQTENTKSGWLREKIKERMKKRLEEKPAPKASTEVTKKVDKPGDYTYMIRQGEIPRYYKVHVPAKYKSNQATALLFVFHGGGGDMEIQSKDEFYGQISKSEEEGHIAVFPNGYSQLKSGKLSTWNAGQCCGDARDQKIDDVGFIKEILKNLKAQLNVDSSRIYATGMSNGGMMSYRLACEMSDVFTGITAVAGTDNTVSCVPTRPISILHIHAKNDDHVLFNGGAGKPFNDLSKVTEFVSVPKTISKWVKFDHCAENPRKILDKPGAYCEEYDKCTGGVHVRLCVTETGGHSWPGGKSPMTFRGKEQPSNAISANHEMWQFFKAQPKR